MSLKWYRITLPYACAGIAVDEIHPYVLVKIAAPIFKWMIGKPFCDIEAWVCKKYGTIEALRD